MSWLRPTLVPAGFSLYSVLRGTDGLTGSTRGPFSGLGFRGVRGW